MVYNFKNLNEVERQDKPTENTTVMAFENGTPKQIPAGEFGGKGLVVDLRGYTVSGEQLTIDDMSYDPIYEAAAAGQNVVFLLKIEGKDAFMYPAISTLMQGTGYLVLFTQLNITFTNGSYHSA